MTSSRAPIRLLTCESGRSFAEQVAESMGLSLVPSKEVWFACGEGKLEINANVRGHDLYIIQSTVGDMDELSVYDRFVMLLHAVEAAALSDAQDITAVLPYFPGARQDKRKGRTREGISAGLFARMLQSAGANRVLTVEIHNDAIAGMFNPAITHLENVFLTRHLSRWLKKKKLTGDVVVAPDVGGLERARRYAEELSADLAALSKERDYSQPNLVTRATLIGDVRERDILLVDDIIDTAGSVIASISELKTHGAKDIIVVCAHPVLSGPALDNLTQINAQAKEEGWRFQLVGTSTIDHAKAPDWYSFFPIEELLGTIIKKINSRGSVTRVYEGR
jgi:ribose-phosphate pyrophosphokinase